MTIKKSTIKKIVTKKKIAKKKGRKVGHKNAPKPKVTIASLSQELKDLKKALNDVRLDHKRFNGNSEKAMRVAQEAHMEAKRVSMILGRDYLIKANEDAKTIMYRYKVNFLKSIVMSEVVGAYSHRPGNGHKENYHMMLLIIKAYDNVDEWWMAREQFTLLQWINALLKEG